MVRSSLYTRISDCVTITLAVGVGNDTKPESAFAPWQKAAMEKTAAALEGRLQETLAGWGKLTSELAAQAKKALVGAVASTTCGEAAAAREPEELAAGTESGSPLEQGHGQSGGDVAQDIIDDEDADCSTRRLTLVACAPQLLSLVQALPGVQQLAQEVMQRRHSEDWAGLAMFRQTGKVQGLVAAMKRVHAKVAKLAVEGDQGRLELLTPRYQRRLWVLVTEFLGLIS
jgi:hypothetical protein